MIVSFNIDEIGLFRPATEYDIVVGNIVFVVGDDDILYRKTIKEVLRPSDPWKAFCADDGCRYGIQDLYVVKSDWFTSKQKKKKKDK